MINTVIAIARQAGALALEHFGRVAPVEKQDRSFVTAADHDVETFIRQELLRHFPDTRIVGEEHADEGDLAGEWVWAIDPIDGTANFVAGLPIWAVSIGLLKDGVPHLGAAYFPALDECFSAVAGQGAFLNGQPTRARQQGGVRKDDLFCISSTAFWGLDLHVPCKVRVLGSAVAEFTYVARGTFIGAVLYDFKLWDCAAGILIAQESGARVSDLQGRPLPPFDLPRDARRPMDPMFVLAPAIAQEGLGYARLKGK
ncbi:MAG: inositol monophosphatase [Abditibacteriales bacterium]|nr:inositol monophosphatase [Abditibacteriales bacterium]MDW8365217.1 inositol monophosphatase [Abditibacteriales bacterium]